MSPEERAQARLDLIVADAHVGICTTLEHIRTEGSRTAALAVARGSLDGLVEWLIVTYGRREAYDVLQRKTDAIIINGGSGNDEIQGGRKGG